MTWLPPVDELRRSAPDFEPPPLPPVPPTIVSLSVDEDLCVEGQDIVLRWETDDAETVTIEGLGDVPTHGSARVLAERSGSFFLLAENEHGGVSASTGEVHVLRMPALPGAGIGLPLVRIRAALSASPPSDGPGRLVDLGPSALLTPLYRRRRSGRLDPGLTT